MSLRGHPSRLGQLKIRNGIVRDRLEAAGVDQDVRDPETGPGEAKPSDHVPVWIEL